MMATTNDIALITGANRGIGFEVARQLGKKGYVVVIGARDARKGAQAVEKLIAEGINAHQLLIDISDPTSVPKAVEEYSKQFGRLDVLVNNAGVLFEFGNSPIPPSQISLQIITDTYNTNVVGTMNVTLSFLPLLRKSALPRIVNVSSIVGSLAKSSDPTSLIYNFNFAAYASSKAAINAITVSFSKELSKEGFKINSVCPGPVNTEMGGPKAPRTPDQGAVQIVKMATVGKDGPTGTFSNDDGIVPW